MSSKVSAPGSRNLGMSSKVSAPGSRNFGKFQNDITHRLFPKKQKTHFIDIATS